MKKNSENSDDSWTPNSPDTVYHCPILDALRNHLGRYHRPDARFFVGFSGGLDSTVLLHALSRIIKPHQLEGIHVNHDLQVVAGQWQEHCEAVGRQLGIRINSFRVHPSELKGKGPEDSARNARLRYFRQFARESGRILLGHHLGDHCETILGNLFRGSGVEGLSGIPDYRPFGEGSLERPLLSIDRSYLELYARQNQLTWVEDPTNAQNIFDRNRIRNEVLPVIRRRWQSVEQSIVRAARNCQEMSALASQIAEQDILVVTNLSVYFPLSDAPVLNLQNLDEFSRERRVNLLRWWISRYTGKSLSRNRFQIVLDKLAKPEESQSGNISWGEWQITRYKQQLYLSPVFPDIKRPSTYWDGVTPLEIAGSSLELIGESCSSNDSNQYQVSFSDSFAKLKLKSRNCSKTVKQLFQENQVIPVLRPFLPRVFFEEKLICVVGIQSVDNIQDFTGGRSWSLRRIPCSLEKE